MIIQDLYFLSECYIRVFHLCGDCSIREIIIIDENKIQVTTGRRTKGDLSGHGKKCLCIVPNNKKNERKEKLCMQK